MFLAEVSRGGGSEIYLFCACELPVQFMMSFLLFIFIKNSIVNYLFVCVRFY